MNPAADASLTASDDAALCAVVDRAIELVADGSRIGLGSGRTVSLFVQRLGARLRQGLKVSAVPTSRRSAELAREAGITLIDLDAGMPLDLTIDGADEVAPNIDLVKGWGGALVRERVVAAASSRQVIIVGSDKLVRRLGERGRLPLEVLTFARMLVLREVEALGLVPTLRMDGAGREPFVSENGNLTLDCALAAPLREESAARELQRALLEIPGVVDTGLFLGTAERVLVGHPDGRVDTMLRSRAGATAP